MTWTSIQIAQHKKAAELLTTIKDATFLYVSKHPKCTEYEVQRFIVKRFKERELKSAISDPIVAFGPSTSDFHYAAPKKNSKVLQLNTLIMIDIWARLNKPRAPFADITWMAFYGFQIPKKMQTVFDTVIKARDTSIKLLKKSLQNKTIPTGREVDSIAMKVLTDAGYIMRKEIQHSTGHSLGTTSPHGPYGGIYFKNKKPLKKNLGYTIEPGLYIKNSFGVRSEIDFYITNKYKLELTTKAQRKLILL